MANVLITGSADGLGLLSAKRLISEGHAVYLHARNDGRAQHAYRQAPGAKGVLVGDLSSIAETKQVARQANGLAMLDVVIHNAGVYQVAATEIFAVNTLAPYILTSLIKMPRRLIYLSSGMHMHGRPNLEGMKHGQVSYSDSKLHVLMLAKAIARHYHGVYANAVDPGWVPTSMGGPGAPDDLQKGIETQTWLAVSNDERAKVSGRCFKHLAERRYNSLADDVELQEQFLATCREVTNVIFPGTTKTAS